MALNEPTTPTNSLGNLIGQKLGNSGTGLLDPKADERLRRALFSNLRLFKGQRLDPDNPHHMALMQRAADAGIEVDPEEWNNQDWNIMRVDMIDLAESTKKRAMFFNKVTGVLHSDAGTSGYVAPIHSDTEMTSAQEGADADHDRAFVASQKQRAVSNELRRASLNFSGQRLELSRAAQDNRRSEQTRKELKDAHALQSQADEAEAEVEHFAGAKPFIGDDGQPHRPSWAVKGELKARSKADALRKQFEGTYGYLTEGGDASGGGAPAASPRALPRRGAPAHASPASSAPAASHGRVSRGNFNKVRSQNPSLSGKSDAEVESTLRAQGYEVY